MIGPCRVRETVLPSGHRAVTLENDFAAVTVLPEKGADIYSLVYKPRAIDVLWKSPWPLMPSGSRPPFLGGNTEAAWMDQYAGGWQEIFPNGGDECVYKNAPLNFHGEASIRAWDYHIAHADSESARVEFHVALRRSPFEVNRTMIIDRHLAGFRIEESIVNKGEEDLHYMWGHHPALGDPFLSGDCILQVPARAFLPPNGVKGKWTGDLSEVADFGYICDLDEGWYGVRSRKHGFGFGLAWPLEVFPYLWFWRETHKSLGYPWYGRCNVMAVEPFSSIPGAGLVNAIAAGTAPLLHPGEVRHANLAAVFYEHSQGELQSISTEGIGTFI